MPGIAEWLGIGKTVAEVTDKATSGVAEIITVAKGDIPPEAKGEIEKLKVQLSGDIEKLLIDAEQKSRDFYLQYEGTATQVPKWILVLRSIIRPAITILTFIEFYLILSVDIWNVFRHTPDYELFLKQLPEGFWVIFGLIIGFWFSGKAVEHAVEKIRGNSSAD